MRPLGAAARCRLARAAQCDPARPANPPIHPRLPPASLSQTPQDPLEALVLRLRSKGGVPWRTAVVGDRRFEFVRGADLAAWLAAAPDVLDRWSSHGEVGGWWARAWRVAAARRVEHAMLGVRPGQTGPTPPPTASHPLPIYIQPSSPTTASPRWPTC